MWAQVRQQRMGEHKAAKDVSVWRQDDYTRTMVSKRWVGSPTFKGDLQVWHRVVGILEEVELQQLALTGSTWESKQREKEAEGKPRSYIAWEANKTEHELKALDRITMHIFDDEAWWMLPEDMLIERFQLRLFNILDRGGGTLYELSIVTLRKGPFRTLHGLKHPCMLIADAKKKGCTHDRYSANFFRTFHGDLDSKAARAELTLLSNDVTIDSTAVERQHHTNQQQAAFMMQTIEPA